MLVADCRLNVRKREPILRGRMIYQLSNVGQNKSVRQIILTNRSEHKLFIMKQTKTQNFLKIHANDLIMHYLLLEVETCL